jgi:hypothetical protein
LVGVGIWDGRDHVTKSMKLDVIARRPTGCEVS